ncbi:UDP-N-acetylmuramate dehydrogenase [Thiomicrospira microaerophila]|uniref:UDP-N-acetylmuramate dehydrogenase n=1 Tax=Thiomicrospira microaerophila TaxID=406020 RepID=UPI0020103D0E|nr:UDP-N-acetylmuramate dehydrogenase [Thiomicrospira microaerophila]UQB41392.1 UDP-N-acetylmuramate dehydrogenase [Thiomicrospira microaerophila]
MHIQANYPITHLNTFNIVTKTRYYVEVNRQSDITVLRSDLKLASLPWTIMGDGSNILFTHDIEGLVIRCSYDKIRIVKEDQDGVWLSVGAGMNWHKLVEYTVNKGWWGLENLAYIPGTVGAAPVQNIGAYGTEARDSITRIQALNLYDGTRTEYRNADCQFGYRSSIFKHEQRNRMLVHRITFRLRKLHAGQANLVYEPLKIALQEQDKTSITPRDVFDAIIKIRQAKLPDPKIHGNAGSFFQNPIVSADYFEQISDEIGETIPHHKMLDGQVKIPAAWLIENAGAHHLKAGRAAVSEKHALVLVNLGGAAGEDVVELSRKIQDEVMHKFGIHLEPEVNIL